MTTITKVVVRCDLCYALKEPLESWAKLTMPQRSKVFVSPTYDLCPACVSSLQAQIEEARIDHHAKPTEPCSQPGSEVEHNPNGAPGGA